MTKWEAARILAGNPEDDENGFSQCDSESNYIQCHDCPFEGVLDGGTITRKMARDWLAANPEPEAKK